MAQATGSIHARPLIPSGASVSNPMLIPRNCSTATFFSPRVITLPVFVNLDSQGPMWKIQSAPVYTDPVIDDEWYDTFAFNPGLGGPSVFTQLIFAFSANQALVLPTTALGAGFIRISTCQTNQTADVTWTVLFSGFYN